MRGAALLTVVVFVAAGTAACGGTSDAPERAADRFEAALEDQDGARACSLLAAATLDELERSAAKPCADAVLDEVTVGGDRVESSRYGTMAQVRYQDDVLFLTRGPDGWQVLAAACRPSRDAAYDCGISGG